MPDMAEAGLSQTRLSRTELPHSSASTVQAALDMRSPTGRTLAEARARLLGDIDAHHREVEAAYAAGYRDGYTAGGEVGYGRRCHEEAAEWAALRDTVRLTANRATPAERAALDRAAVRGVPCSRPACSGCSRCVRAAAVARHGGDYQGGPVEWEPRPAREVA